MSMREGIGVQGPTPPSRPVPPVVPGAEKQQSSGTDGAQHATGNEQTDRQTGTTPAKADTGATEGSVVAPNQTVNKGAPEFKTTIVEKTTAPSEKVTGQMPDSIPLLKGLQSSAADTGANHASGGDKPSANTGMVSPVAARDAGADGHGFFFYGVGLLILAVLLFIVWEIHKTNRQAVRRSEPEPSAVIPDSRSRTLFDYSVDSGEVVDLITGQEKFEPALTKPKIAKVKPQQTVKSNFEIRV